MNDLAREFMMQNFYYTYLKGRLEKARESGYRKGILVVGSSHALYGIQENILGNAVNCSMHSQDIYYDCLCIKKVIDGLDAGDSYRYCVLMMGYYMPFQDLSLSKNLRHDFVSRTYYPIFHDAHNWENPDIYDHWEFCHLSSTEERASYEKEALDHSKHIPFFSEQSMRRKTLYDFGGRRWEELSTGEKTDFGNMRARSHSSLEVHEHSYHENMELLKDIAEYLNEKNVRLLPVIAPFTSQYNNGVSSSMKEAFLKMMDDAGISKVLDFNEEYAGVFEDSDFMDMDHLNETGSIKLSGILKNEILV